MQRAQPKGPPGLELGNYLIAYATTEGYVSWAVDHQWKLLDGSISQEAENREGFYSELGIQYENVLARKQDAAPPSSSDISCLQRG